MNDLLPWLLLFAVTLAWYLDRQAACPPPPSPAPAVITDAPGQAVPRRASVDSVAVPSLSVARDSTALLAPIADS